MAQKVPAILMLCAVVSLGAKAADLNDLQKEAGCDGVEMKLGDGRDAISSWACKGFQETVCENAKVGSCPQHRTNPKRPQPVEIKSDLVSATSDQTFNDIKTKEFKMADDLKNQGTQCCDPTANCQAGATADSLKAAAGTSDGAKGAVGAASNSRSQHRNLMKLNASLGGSCNAYKVMSLAQYSAMRSGADQATCKDSGCKQAFNTFKSEVEKRENDAKALSDTNDARLANAAATDAGEADNDTTLSGTPGGGTSNGGKSANPNTGAADGGGNPMNMLGQLAGPMMAMAPLLMGQNNDPNANNPASNTNAQPTCTDSTVGCFAAAGPATPGNWKNDPESGTASTVKSTGNSNFASLGDGGSRDPIGNGMNTASLGAGSPITTHGIQGGGGGGPPGAGGATSASLGGGGGGGGGAGAPPKGPNILQGEGGHGAITTAGPSMQTGGGGGGYTYGGPAGAGQGDGLNGLRLADFLPGGKNDPTGRNVASVAQPIQIQSKTTNIFARITERIRTRCAAGLLRDCGPQ